MATNFYFNNFKSKADQQLIEDLIVESIKIYGIDVMYVPRKVINLSEEFREQAYSEYVQAINVEMYIKNIDGFEGEGEFLSSFGVEVREQITFSVAVKTFNEEVGTYVRRDRPLESDLIFFPFNKALYQIKYVNRRPVFYQMGALQFYDVVAELFEYSNEVFRTGVPDIDDVYNSFQTTIDTYNFDLEEGEGFLLTEDGDQMYSEEYVVDYIQTNAQNQTFEQQADGILDFTYIDPFSEGQYRA